MSRTLVKRCAVFGKGIVKWDADHSLTPARQTQEKTMRKLSKKTLAVATTVALLAGGGAAFAYWTTTGAGTGSATNASANGTIVLHAAFAGGLTPGASQAVTYTADNAGTS